jgi:hypothetical protein
MHQKTLGIEDSHELGEHRLRANLGNLYDDPKLSAFL